MSAKEPAPSCSSNEARRRAVETHFADANRCGEPELELSPSGRYALAIQTYPTGANTWAYTRGTVTRVSTGEIVCDLKRNYSTFHHSFVTKDDRELLVTGR